MSDTMTAGGDAGPGSLAYAMGGDSEPYSPSPAGKSALKEAAADMAQRKGRADKAIADVETRLSGLKPPQLMQLPEEPTQHSTSPGEQWGSLAMMFAVFGSLVSRRPFVNALNASAAAMNAYNQGDLRRYQQETAKWKIESENAERLARFQQDAYKDELEKARTSLDFYKSASPTMAAFKEEAAMKLALSGRTDEAMQLISGRGRKTGALSGARAEALKDTQNREKMLVDLRDARSSLQQAEASGDQDQINRARQHLDYAKQSIQDYDYATTKGAGVLNYEERTNHDRASEDATRDKLDELKRKNLKAEGQTDIKVEVEQGKLTVQQAQEKERERHNQFMEGLDNIKVDSEAARQEMTRARDEEIHRHNVQMEGIATKREAAADEKVSQPMQVEITDPDGKKHNALAQQKKDGSWVTADAKRTPLDVDANGSFKILKGADANNAGEQLLTPRAKLLAAWDYIKTGHMPALGFGGVAAARARAEVVEEASRILEEQGMQPQDLAALRAGVHSDTMAATVLGRLRANVSNFEKTAAKEADLAEKLMDKGASPGSIPVVNRWIQSGRASVQGDPDVTNFNAALISFKNEYARIMSSPGASGGVTSDAARNEADELINRAMTEDQLRGVFRTMKRGMQNRIESINEEYDDTIKRIKDVGTKPAQGNIIEYDASGNRVQR